MEELPVWLLPLLGYVAGFVLRVFWPYFIAYLETGTAFDWRYVSSQVAGALTGLIPVLLAGSLLHELPALGFLGAMGAGYIAGNAGRQVASAIEKR